MEQANPSFRQWLRNAAHRSGVPAWWHWWMAELAPLMPAGPRNALRRRRLRPLLAIDSCTAVLFLPGIRNGTLAFEEVARIPLTDETAAVARAGRAAIEALPRAAHGGKAKAPSVVVALAEGQVLRKTLTIPAAAEENLKQVLAYDLDRHTPFKPDEVYFDAVVVGRDAARKEIRVDWVAALKTTVEQARRRAEGWGATVVGVTSRSPREAAAPAGSALNLLPEGERPAISAWRRLEIWLPLALVAVVALVATALPLWQKRG